MTIPPAGPCGTSRQVIHVAGARTHNLKNISVDIPKHALTVFTGVSGSGKSSLVFGTIAAESQRMLNETYPAFVQGFLPQMERPDVDVLEGVTAAIIVDQERMGANARSTVGTATDAHALLRSLFSALGQPHVGSPQAFSFNIPPQAVTGRSGSEPSRETRLTGGQCARCEGMGTVTDIDLTQLYDAGKSLAQGALRIPGYTPDGLTVRGFIESGLVPADIPIRDFTEQQTHDFLHHPPQKIRVGTRTTTYEGLLPRIRKSFLSKDLDSLRPHVREFAQRVAAFTVCPDCHGTRLNSGARSSMIEGINIADACAMQISDLARWLRSLGAPGVAPLLNSLNRLCDAFVETGLGYLSLDRPSGSLSGGEAQRTKMIRHLGSSLTDVTYIFDEPTTGLHPHDVDRMNTLLRQLRDKGNTVLVVEHKPATITIADHVIDLGPHAGSAGGHITFQGPPDLLRTSETLTGRHLEDRTALKTTVRRPCGQLPVRGARHHNLQGVDVDIPLGVLVAVTGVAGSGKSSLIHGSVTPREGVVSIDQNPIRGSKRSSPATYTGLLDPIRAAFAKANGVAAALFSANSEGACPACQGVRHINTGTATTTCEECQGTGFDPSVLKHTLAGKNIHDVLTLPVREAADFFGPTRTHLPAARTILERMNDVGLGYLPLGQPLTTLSGGERQRLKLAAHMGTPADIYVLDEPTTGLHLADVTHLLSLLDRLVDAGKTVIVIEHHQAVMAHSDWIIDIGPGAGLDGGHIVYEGTPAALAATSSTTTGEHLARYLGG